MRWTEGKCEGDDEGEKGGSSARWRDERRESRELYIIQAIAKCVAESKQGRRRKETMYTGENDRKRSNPPDDFTKRIRKHK